LVRNWQVSDLAAWCCWFLRSDWDFDVGVKKAASGRVYQMRIALKGMRPPIWRRVQVPGTLSLAAFHDVIQTVFGWTDTHLH